MTEPHNQRDDGLYVLYDPDLGALRTTEVFRSSDAAAEAIDPRLGNVLIVRLSLDDVELSPQEDPLDDNNLGDEGGLPADA
jgi:hypothetical protein